ncbi:MAG TPA: MFS transporter [Candidatus Binatia bacterium]|jgi:sugar phosphate permease|nr:MFS transporter [Candidatus Binatia bacterium]
MAWPVRYNIVGLLTLGTMINYIDRVNISVAAPDIMRGTGWDKAQFGLVFSAFLVGYALFQYPGGLIADRWSARKALALSCLGFSLFTALTPLGQSVFLLLLFLRFLVGACESASFPSLASLNARWVPRQEYGRAQTLSISGAALGQMVAYPTTTWLIEHFSWETVFYVNATVGILWMTLWLAYSTDTPREHRAVGAEELREIEGGLVPRAAPVAVPLWSILRSPSVLFLCLSYMFFGFIAWIFILWFPTYLVEARGFSRMHMGLVGMLPTGASFLGIVAGGVVSDYLLKRGCSVRTARARFPGLTVGLSLPFLLTAVTTPSATFSVILFICFYFTLSLAVSGYWSMPLELNPRLVGAISGVMNTAGNLAGIFGPLTAGIIVARTGNWELPFYLVGVLGVLCGLIFVFLVSTKPVEVAGLAPAAPLREAAK